MGSCAGFNAVFQPAHCWASGEVGTTCSISVSTVGLSFSPPPTALFLYPPLAPNVRPFVFLTPCRFCIALPISCAFGKPEAYSHIS